LNGKGQNEFTPDYAVAPGIILEEWLEEHGLTQAELSQRTGRSRKMINELIQGAAALTAETAIQLERVTQVPAQVWAGLEMNYRAHLARKAEHSELSQLKEWVKKFSYKRMADMGWVPQASNVAEKARHLLTYFGVASPDQWAETYGCVEGLARKSPAYTQDIEDLSAWLRQGELTATRCPCAMYDEKIFRKALQELRSATRQDLATQFFLMANLCSQAGVAFVIVPELPKTRVSGFTRWLPLNKPLIQLSLRHKRDDHLWFTFFHEAAHILLHGKKEIFLEFEKPQDNPKEHEANTWAANFLIPQHDWNRFVRQHRNRFYINVVSQFAEEQGIAPGIVAGRLQHEKLVPPSWYKDLFVRIDLPALINEQLAPVGAEEC
jgi:HTH-type transcriptional regulator/antitoxin HigA